MFYILIRAIYTMKDVIMGEKKRKYISKQCKRCFSTIDEKIKGEKPDICPKCIKYIVYGSLSRNEKRTARYKQEHAPKKRKPKTEKDSTGGENLEKT